MLNDSIRDRRSAGRTPVSQRSDRAPAEGVIASMVIGGALWLIVATVWLAVFHAVVTP